MLAAAMFASQELNRCWHYSLHIERLIGQYLAYGYIGPLILSVPRDNYSDVAFIENGSPVKTVPLTTASPPRHR